MDEGWGRSESFTFAARLVLGGRAPQSSAHRVHDVAMSAWRGRVAAMLAIVLAVSLATALACVGDGHNHHRSRTAVKRFQKFWARAHGGLPCPRSVPSELLTVTVEV
jgi:hypothetical protein